MMNPRVGLTALTSSPIIRLTIVVFPALSRPLVILAIVFLLYTTPYAPYSIKILISLSLSLAFRSIDSIIKIWRTEQLVDCISKSDLMTKIYQKQRLT